MILYGVAGVGKTSFAAQIPGVCFLIDQQEHGIHTLKDSGLVPRDTPVFPAAQSWQDVFEVIESLRTEEHLYKALAIDSMSGLETLCTDYVKETVYGGRDKGKEGFDHFSQGLRSCCNEWRRLIIALDELRFEKPISIVLLAHEELVDVTTPAEDYKQYDINVDKRYRKIMREWVDILLFASFELAFTEDPDGRKTTAKAHGGGTRLLYTQFSAMAQAKNRHNLPEEINMGSSAAEAWANFVEAIKNGRKV